MVYRMILWLHVVSIISWMAGLLYLIRLFVYHAEEKEAVVRSRFCTMEQRLYSRITNPAMFSSLFFGIALLFLQPDYLRAPWLHAKLLFVVLLVGATHMARRWMRLFAQEKNEHSSLYFRIVNEIPTVLMLLIVFFVIVRPFS